MKMLTRKKSISIFIAVVAFVYLWNFVFYDIEWLAAVGSSVFSIIVGLLSLRWALQASSVREGKGKNIWFIMSIGLSVHITGNVIWLINCLIERVYLIPDIAYIFWLLGYSCFLIAIICKLRLISPRFGTNQHLFNTAIFILVIFAICVHYLFTPYLATAESLFQLIVFGLFFPVVDVSILFVITLLYFLLRHSKEREIMLYFLVAFYLQIIGDSISAYLKINKEYYQLFLEPIWIGSLLLIGFAGVLVQNSKRESLETKVIHGEKETIFPYISTILLFVLAFQSYQWKINALSLGVGIIFFLIIGRHLLIIKRNKNLMIEYRQLAYQDSLTGLSNRSSFKKDLEYALKKVEFNKSAISLLLIDLDRFKMVNDTLGHLIGDRLLKMSANQLRNSLGSECDIYRLGGDEFVVLLRESTKEKCISIANQIIEVFQSPFLIQDNEITITTSVGISTFPVDGMDSDSLFKAADAAMYLAKGKGRNNYQFYNFEINQMLNRKMTLEVGLRKAISENELELFYQPKFNLLTREVVGMEALLRWNSKELGSISPFEFIPIAEDTGLIMSIGEWVINRACMQNKEWQDKGLPSVCISVNVSVQQFKQSNIVSTVERALTQSGLNQEYLELEITESIMQNIEKSKKTLARLSELGVKISLDDFGTGYSSLHVLKDLPINTLKIDKTFIDDITDETNENERSMVKGIIDIASNLKLQIVAEGVEHEYQVKALAAYQCDYGQGYWFGRPVSAVEFEEKFLRPS